MEIPIAIFLSFIAIQMILVVIGLWKKIPVLMFLCGFLFFFWAIMTDTIIMGYSTNEIGASALYHYNVESGAGSASISGLTNPQVRGEYIFSTSSMLYLDEIDCIDVLLRKSASPTLTYEVGIFDHAQTDSDPLLKSFGTGNSAELSTIFEWKTFCLPVGETYVLQDQDVAGVSYKEASATNVVQIGIASLDVFDSSQTEHTSQSSSLFTWTNFATTDTNLRLYLRSDAGFLTTEQTFLFDAYPKLLFILIGSLIMVIGAIVWKMPDEKKN